MERNLVHYGCCPSPITDTPCALLGGLAEYLSLLMGFQFLLLLVAARDVAARRVRFNTRCSTWFTGSRSHSWQRAS